MAVSHRERLTLPAKGVFRQLLPRKPPYSVGGPSLGHTGYERPKSAISLLYGPNCVKSFVHLELPIGGWAAQGATLCTRESALLVVAVRPLDALSTN